MAYTPNSWNPGDKITKTKLDRLEAAVAESLSEADADATYGPRRSVFASTYLTAGASASANVTALNQAIADAVTQGIDVCFDGVTCQINAELNLNQPVRLWSSTSAACHITQTVLGQGVFFVYANGVTLDGFTLTGPVVDNGTSIDLTGWTGDVHSPSAIKVDCGVDSLKIRRIVVDKWFCGLAGFPYPFTASSTPAVNYEFITNLDVEDFTVSSVWSGVRMSGLENARFDRVRGSYKPAIGHSVAVTAPPHLFYITSVTESVDVPRAYNIDVRLSNCHGQDGRGGSPFSLRYTKGMTWSNLTADNCEGLVDMIGVKGFHGSGGHSTRDCYPQLNDWNGNRGSLSLLYCDDGTIDPVVIEGAAAFQHGSILYVGVCQNVAVLETRGWIDLPVADGALRGAYASGRKIRIVRPTIECRGASSAIGITLASGFNDTDSTVTLDDPAIRGSWLRGIDIWPTTTKQTVIYDPDKIESANQDIRFALGVTEAGSPNLINTRYGHPPAQDARVVGWNFGEKLADGAVFRTRWPSGQISTVVTDAWVPTPPYLSANATVTGLLCADFGSPDVDIDCSVKYGTGAGSVGLALRAIDASNFLSMMLTSTSVLLVKRVGGTYTTLATVALTPATVGIWRDLRVRALGSLIIGYVDGVQAFSHTLTGGDETTFATAQSHGLRSDNGGANSGWYRLRVRKAA